MTKTKKSLSIIVPSYNDGANVKTLVAQLAKKRTPPFDVWIVESADASYFRSAPKYPWVHYCKGEKGRARQMNYGARKSKGSHLLFLHADSNVANLDFSQILKSNGWGCFEIGFDSNHWCMPVVIWASTTRVRRSKLVYGDQGMFCTRALFEKSGGFNEEKPFEDINISHELRKYSNPIQLKGPIITSARRFLKHGPLRTGLTMQMIRFTYEWGFVSLSKWLYKTIR